MAVKHVTDEEIQRYLDGDVPRDSEISRHLKRCATCWQELQSYRQVYRALEDDSGLALSPGFPETVMGGLTRSARGTSRSSLVVFILIIFGSVVALGTALSFANGMVVIDMLRGITSEIADMSHTLVESLQKATSGLGVSLDILLFTTMLLLMISVLDCVLLRSRRSHFCL